MKSLLSKNAWVCGGGQRNRAIRDHSQCNLLSAKQELVEAGILQKVTPAYFTIVENAGKALERLLQDDIDLSEESQEQQRIKIYIADALNTLNRIATKADAMLIKQIEHYQGILVTSQKQGRESQ